MPTTTQALRKAGTAQRALNVKEAAADKAAQERNAAVLAAQEAGATYPAIQEATGLSPARVAQVLARAKRAAETSQEN